MLFIGVDPGNSGALAAVSSAPMSERALVFPTPDFEAVRAAVTVIRSLAEDVYPVAAVEKVHAFPGQGVSSSFTFGKSYGSVIQGLVDGDFAILDVTPREWMRALGLPSREEAGSKTAKKNAHKAMAAALFPDVKVTHAVADALLIARWFETQMLQPD